MQDYYYNTEEEEEEKIKIPKCRFTEKEILEKIILKYKINIDEIITEMNDEQKEREKSCKSHEYMKSIDNGQIFCIKCDKINNCNECSYYIYFSHARDERIYVEKKCSTCGEKYNYYFCKECGSNSCFCGCPKGCYCDGRYY
jgi:hypothetical protein